MTNWVKSYLSRYKLDERMLAPRTENELFNEFLLTGYFSAILPKYVTASKIMNKTFEVDEQG